MKTNKIIIYDDCCPMCAAYTKAFVSTGMIEPANRKNFSTIDPALMQYIDTNRCKNEIPVLDADTKQVWYGVDALTEVLQLKIHGIKKVVAVKPVKWFADHLYKFISYNRKVIVASSKPAGNFDCTPNFNYTYRIAFLLCFLTINSLLLFPIHDYILQNSFVKVTSGQLTGSHFVLVCINIITGSFLGKKMMLEYLGQINMLATETALLCLPLMAANIQGFVGHFINNICISLLLAFACKEYVRRMKYIGILTNHRFIVYLNFTGIFFYFIYLLV